MNRRAACSARRGQRGQGLLLLMLVMLVAGASVLLEGIGSRATIRAVDDERTTRALALAKEALIAYAVLDANRPGELPCPDFNRNGIINPIGNEDYAHPNCRTRRGWLPWRTLDMEDVRDGAGEPLWYVVAQNYFARSGTGLRPAINPDTIGGLSVDSAGATDIVAVIIAPGEARGDQLRPADPPGGAPNAAAHVAEYLEGANADADLDTYAGSGGADFNDRVIYITAQELLRAVEQRVLGEVAVALSDYRTANGAYPWLSPFRPPAAADPAAFDGVPGTRVGHLAFNDDSDEGTHVQDTGFTVSWTAGDANVAVVDIDVVVPLEPVPALLQLVIGSAIDSVLLLLGTNAENDLAAGSETFPMPTQPTGANPSACTWQGDVAVVHCQATGPLQPAGDIAIDLGLAVLTGPIRRQFSFDLAYTGLPLIHAADSTHPAHGARLRNVSSISPFQNFPLPSSVSTITVRHEVVLEALGIPIYLVSVTRRLEIVDGSSASVDVDEMYFEPLVGPGIPGDMVLPDWFFTNQWEQFVLVEYATNALPGESLAAGSACTPGSGCVSLHILDGAGDPVGAPRDDLHAVVVGAGSRLASQDRSSAASLADYFEGSNAIDDDAAVERRVRGSLFNDQVRVVEPPPP